MRSRSSFSGPYNVVTARATATHQPVTLNKYMRIFKTNKMIDNGYNDKSKKADIGAKLPWNP